MCLAMINPRSACSDIRASRGRKIYEPPRFMTVGQAIEQLLEIEDRRKEAGWYLCLLC